MGWFRAQILARNNAKINTARTIIILQYSTFIAKADICPMLQNYNILFHKSTLVGTCALFYFCYFPSCKVKQDTIISLTS